MLVPHYFLRINHLEDKLLVNIILTTLWVGSQMQTFLSFFLSFVENASKSCPYLTFSAIYPDNTEWMGQANIGYCVCRFLTFSFIYSVMHDTMFQDNIPTLFNIRTKNIASSLLIMLCIDYNPIDHSLSQYSHKAPAYHIYIQ